MDAERTPDRPLSVFVGQGDAIPDAGEDVVELPVPDDYDHLPQKVFAFFAYVRRTRGAAWVFKCDDDTYVDLHRLMELAHPGVDLVGDMSLRRRNAPSGGAGYLIAEKLLTHLLQEPLPSATGAEDLIVGALAARFQAVSVATDRLGMTPAPYPMPHNNLVSAHWCDPGYLRAIHSFNHSSPKAVFRVERTGWGNAEHLAFYASGYFRREATGCAGKFAWQNGNLLLQWFSFPHEQLARFGPSLLGSETALEPADMSSRSWMEKRAAPAGKRLVHLGCGENRLNGWFNADLPHFDITRPLPWDDETVDGLFLEHVIEHVSPTQACGFLREARRILKPGGTLRLAFPDVVRIAERATPEYLAFLQRKGWGDGSPGSAVTNIVENHGHAAVWSLPTLTVVLKALGFEVEPAALGTSRNDDMTHLERHDSQLGSAFNELETSCVEATKPF